MQTFAWALPLVSGFMDAVFRGIIKVTDVHRFTLAAGGHLFALPIYAVWLLAEGMPPVHPTFWLWVSAHVPLYALITVLIVEAHRSSEMILTLPYLSLTPAYQLLISPIPASITGRGWPTVWGVLGVLVLVGGIYLLNTRDDQVGFLEPFKRIRFERGSRLMFYAGAIAGVSGVLDYLAITSANVPLYLLADHGIVGLVLAGLALYYVRRGWALAKEMSPAGAWKALAAFGGVTAAVGIPHAMAFRWIPEVAYVFAAKRAGTILFGVGIGLALATLKRFGGKYAGEREHLKWRIPGVLLVVAGMVLIILWGRSP